MKKGFKIFFRILQSIIAVPLGIIGAVCLTPFVLLGLLFTIPATIICDIWDLDLERKYNNYYKDEE